jgi:hypothetical protein
MLWAAHVIVRVYGELASPLTRAHGLPYPDGLARVMTARLERLGTAREPSAGVRAKTTA